MCDIYKCCICHKPIERNKRLVYQEFDGKKPYGAFHTKCHYDFCDRHFAVFQSWLIKNKNKNDLKIGVEIDL